MHPEYLGAGPTDIPGVFRVYSEQAVGSASTVWEIIRTQCVWCKVTSELRAHSVIRKVWYCLNRMIFFCLHGTPAAS